MAVHIWEREIAMLRVAPQHECENGFATIFSLSVAKTMHTASFVFRCVLANCWKIRWKRFSTNFRFDFACASCGPTTTTNRTKRKTFVKIYEHWTTAWVPWSLSMHSVLAAMACVKCSRTKPIDAKLILPISKTNLLRRVCYSPFSILLKQLKVGLASISRQTHIILS